MATTPNPPTGPAKYKAMTGTAPAAATDATGISGGPVGGDKPNFTPTSDPDTHMGKYGVPIRRSEYEAASRDPKNGLKFDSFDHYADWVGGWARPTKTPPPDQPQGKGPAGRPDSFEGHSTQGSGAMRYHQ